jgi:glycosyltransferase involved in cell wall biosynthesis
VSPGVRDVAFYAPWAGPTLSPSEHPTGGAEVQVGHLARGLARRGASVVVLTYATPGLGAAVEGVEIATQHRPPWRFVPARRAGVLATTIVGLLRLRARTLVQRSAGGTTGLVALAALVTRRRFVYSSASTLDFDFQRRGARRLTLAMFDLGIRLADEIVVQTDEQAALCVERYGRQPVVIRSVAIPAPAGAAGADTEGFLWIGRLAPGKRPFAFLDLAATLPEAPFTMVCVPGDGVERHQRVREQAAALPNVTVLGPQPRPVLLERVARATAIVSTSSFEGMPNTLIEGWSRGVPALTLSHDPDGLIARHGLGSTCGDDPVALAEAARTLWKERADDGPLRERCRAFAIATYDPDTVLAGWEAVLGLGTRTVAGARA